MFSVLGVINGPFSVDIKIKSTVGIRRSPAPSTVGSVDRQQVIVPNRNNGQSALQRHLHVDFTYYLVMFRH